MRFFFTDVFGSEAYTGNQLATFLDCGDLSTDHMQRIAREVNFSETTFVTAPERRQGAWDVRIFTPLHEIDFAGHPTLGTAFVIAAQLEGGDTAEVVLNLRAGRVPVTLPKGGAPTADDWLWMRQPEPSFGRVLDAGTLAEVLGLEPGEVASTSPVEEVSTGLPVIVVPLTTIDALRRAVVDEARYRALIENTWAKAILVFAAEGRDESTDVSVRVFASYYGIAEDPATGSGNGCLAAYLVRHGLSSGEGVDVRSGQGHEVGRPSILALRASAENGSIRVHVGGRVIPIAQGRWS